MKTINENDEKGNRQSGVIWHTQGSGKSLTMVMLAKYILMELASCHPRVVIVTDRKELDGQIAATFSHTRLNPARATSGRHLVELVNSEKADVITSIINKFNTAERQEAKNYSRDVFILVDESHRSNYGLMATKMRSVFPNACYIGFTGTPLMKREKNTMSKFGKLIHKYTINIVCHFIKNGIQHTVKSLRMNIAFYPLWIADSAFACVIVIHDRPHFGQILCFRNHFFFIKVKCLLDALREAVVVCRIFITLFADAFCHFARNGVSLRSKGTKLVKFFLDQQCQAVFGEVMDELYPMFRKYGVKKPSLRIREMETRWGSCLVKKGIVTLNKRLLEAPRNCIEYVVMHELCHLIHPNHSKQFYSFLAMLMPDWKERKQFLDRTTTFWL